MVAPTEGGRGGEVQLDLNYEKAREAVAIMVAVVQLLLPLLLRHPKPFNAPHKNNSPHS